MDPSRIEEIHDGVQGVGERVRDLELVVLFGSTAKGRRRAGSDVDVAVRCAGPLLAVEVARAGRLLFESRRGTFRQFQSLASRRYCDTAKLRRAQRRAIHVFLARHDLSP
jgi:predicted nucleotidyltransferase